MQHSLHGAQASIKYFDSFFETLNTANKGEQNE